MKKLWFTFAAISITLFMVSCGGKQQSKDQSTAPAQDSSRQSYITAITAVEAKMKNSTTGLDMNTANLAISEYQTFATKFPSDTLAPDFLFRAGNTARSSNQFERALGFYNNVSAKYPDFKRIPDCIFVEGFIYDNDLKDTAKAHVKYQEVITKYPKSVYAPQAEAAIAALGKSPDELVKEFEAKAKKQGNKPRT